LLAPRPTPKLEGHPLSAFLDCLFNIFTTTLHIWRPSPLFATWGRAMPWWQGTHLTWLGTVYTKNCGVNFVWRWTKLKVIWIWSWLYLSSI
jgi:hypothetical protein